jgi:hypothetical protein
MKKKIVITFILIFKALEYSKKSIIIKKQMQEETCHRIFLSKLLNNLFHLSLLLSLKMMFKLSRVQLLIFKLFL